MAAKRLGSFLSNVTGTAGQVLRVNSGETGFEMFTPATIPAYTVTNKTVDRIINADDVTLDEVADVLGTLIDDLSAMGSTGATQQVFTSQVYSHTSSVGGTGYTLTHNFGRCPDKVVCYFDHGGYYEELYTVFPQNSDLYGWSPSDTTTDVNVCKVRVFQLPFYPSGTRNIFFRCFILGQVAQINPFQWSTSEQVWPFEKDDQGRTLYARKVYISDLGYNGVNNIPATFLPDYTKLFRIEAYSDSPSNGFRVPLSFVNPNNLGSGAGLYVKNNTIVVHAGSDSYWDSCDATFYVIYAK